MAGLGFFIDIYGMGIDDIAGMKLPEKNGGPFAPSKRPGPVPNSYTVLKNTMRITVNVLILLIICASCGSMKVKVNGVTVRERTPMRKEEKRIYIASFVAGFAIGTVYQQQIRNAIKDR